MKHLSIPFLSLFLLIVLLGAGCAGSKQTETPVAIRPEVSESADRTSDNLGSNNSTVVSNDHAGGEHIAKLAGSRVDVKGKNNLKTGDVKLSFTLYGEDGHAFGPNDLITMHEKKLHLLLVRDDMTRFQHLHPEYVKGSWAVSTNIPDQGNYQLYVDIAPIEEDPSVLRVPLTITGETQNPQAPEPNADWSAQDGAYTAKLMIDQPLKTKETKQWTFAITKAGQPVVNIKPYLGAFGHVVELRHTDPDDFYHVHPVTEIQPQDGNVVFEGTFPTKGRYTLYAQFNVPEGVKTFPITVDVEEDGVAQGSGGAH